MKSIKYLLLSILLVSTISIVSAQSNEVPAVVIAALNQGDATRLSANFNNNVELVIDKRNDVFSKLQATAIITDFFRVNKVVSFELLHKGNKDASSFAIGMLKTNKGNFRVYVLTRNVGDKPLVQQLRIEPSNE